MGWKKNISNLTYVAVIGVDAAGLVFGVSIMVLLDPNAGEGSRALAHLLLTPSATLLLTLSVFLVQKLLSEKRKKDILDAIQKGNAPILGKLKSLDDIKTSLASIDHTQKAAVQTQKDTANILKNMVNVLKEISAKI